MAATIPTIPAILTADDWNKKKGVVAKIVAVPTKMGDALRNIDKAYKSVKWSIIFSVPAESSKLIDVDNHIVQVKGGRGAYDLLLDEIDVAKTLAAKTKGEWDANKLIPKESKTHLENLAKALVTFKTKIETDYQAVTKQILEVRTKIFNEKRADDVKAQKESMESKDATGKTIGGTSGPVVKTGPKTEGIKTKFKPQPAPAAPKPKT